MRFSVLNDTSLLSLLQDLIAYVLLCELRVILFFLIIPGAGELFVCGHNKEGQLGLNHTENVLCFTLCAALSGFCVQEVACGWDFTIILGGKPIFAGVGGVWGCGEHADSSHCCCLCTHRF